MRVVKLMCLALWCAFLGYGTYYFVAVDPDHDVILYYWGLTGVAVFFWFMGHVVNPVIGPYLSKAGDSFGEFNVCCASANRALLCWRAPQRRHLLGFL
jgi:hypothetical protein